MDFALPAHVERYRQEIPQIIRVHVTAEVTDRQHGSGTFHSPELNKALADRGFIEWAIPGLGRGDQIELWVLFNLLEKAGAPYDGLAKAGTRRTSPTGRQGHGR